MNCWMLLLIATDYDQKAYVIHQYSMFLKSSYRKCLARSLVVIQKTAFQCVFECSIASIWVELQSINSKIVKKEMRNKNFCVLISLILGVKCRLIVFRKSKHWTKFNWFQYCIHLCHYLLTIIECLCGYSSEYMAAHVAIHIDSALVDFPQIFCWALFASSVFGLMKHSASLNNSSNVDVKDAERQIIFTVEITTLRYLWFAGYGCSLSLMLYCCLSLLWSTCLIKNAMLVLLLNLDYSWKSCLNILVTRAFQLKTELAIARYFIN